MTATLSILDFSFEELSRLSCHEVESLLPDNLYIQDKIRDLYFQEYGFSVPCKEAVEAIKSSNKLIGIGSGTGNWENVLGIKGYDIKEDIWKFKHSNDIINMSAQDAVKDHPGYDVFCSWPSYDDEWFFEAVCNMTKGTKLFFIGEGQHGCTATDSFFESDKFKLIKYVSIPQIGISKDYLMIFDVVH